MGIYSTGSVITENYLENIDVQESTYEPGFEGALQNIIDEEVNYSKLMEAVAIAELSHFEQHGTELVYEGANLSGFFSKVREFFKNMYEKIKGLFKKFIGFIDALIMNDKAFVNKYRTTILSASTKDFEYKGYVFTINDFATRKNLIDEGRNVHGFKLDVRTADNAKTDEYDNATKEWKEKREDIIEQMRGAVAGDKSKKYDEGDFTKAIFESLRDGKDKPETISTVNPSSELNIISAFKESKKVAEKQFKDLEKGINDTIKALNDAEKTIGKAMTGKDEADDKGRAAAIRYVSAGAEAEKILLGLGQKAQGLTMSAMKQQYRQAKAICVKLINYKPKNESVDLTGGAFGDILFQ